MVEVGGGFERLRLTLRIGTNRTHNPFTVFVSGIGRKSVGLLTAPIQFGGQNNSMLDVLFSKCRDKLPELW